MDFEGPNAADNLEGIESTTNLIINYLPQTLTDQEFRSMFLSIGPIKMAKIVRDKKSGYSYGFGFVDYENEGDAERAITTLNGLQMQHKRIKVAYSRKGETGGESVKGANLYIRGLPLFWTENELNSYFEPFGKIVQSRVLVDLQTGTSRRVGFVLYSKRTEAEKAIETLDSKPPPDSPDNLYLKFADDSSKKVRAPALPPNAQYQQMGAKPRFNSPGPMRNQRNRPHYNPMAQNGSSYGNGANPSYGGATAGAYGATQTFDQQSQPEDQQGYVLFVYNIGPEADERILWQLFGPCGTVTKVTVMMDKEKSVCKGFGFVTMPNLQEAEYAIQIRNGTMFNGKPLQVSFKK